MSTLRYGAHLTANGIRQHYLRYGGAGRPIVVVPGITSPAVTWGFVAERLGRDYDTYVLDARGRGLSSAEAALDYGLDALADDLASAIEALGLQNPSLLGHSMGARIAIRAVRRHRLRLHRLVLVDPPVTGPGRRPYPTPLTWYVDSIRLASAGCDVDAMRRFCPSWTEDQLRLRAEWLHTCHEGAIVRSYNDFHDTDIHADLPQVAVPALLVVAGNGLVVRAEEAAELARLMPMLTVTTVDDSGHMIPWDNFDGFFRAIDPFLAGCQTTHAAKQHEEG